MIDFNLIKAHPKYQKLIPDILRPLVELYRGAPLKAVRIYQPKPDDTSMGATYLGAEIRLNSYWFARDPEELQAAAKQDFTIQVNNHIMGWHGRMIIEPTHCLVHEMGHVINFGPDALKIKTWSEKRWSEATQNPVIAPSGYALSNPSEFFGEMFALVHLGLSSQNEIIEIEDLLHGSRSL